MKSLHTFLIALLFILGIQWLFSSTEKFIGRVCFGEECPSNRGAGAMCHQLASSNCQIPQASLNDCWLNAYRNCVDGCRAGGKVCDCAEKASMQCMGRHDPALACYESVHQKCMAGMGFAIDPDRGRGTACF